MTKTIRVTAILLIALTALTTSELKGQSSGGGRLTGTWDTMVTLYNCQTGDMIREFPSTGSFNQGGTFTGITSGFSGAARSPEIGIWEHQKDSTYKLRFKAYQYDAMGVAFRYQIVTHSVIVDTDNLHYVSDGGVEFFNMDGTPAGSGCSSAIGTRMVF